MKKIDVVTVIGANGTMGANVSAIFASFGNAKVYLVCRDMQKAERAVAKVAKSVRAESIIKNLFPADYSALEACVEKSDLVFESVAEDLEIKRDITEQVAKYLHKDAVACSGTSGLSVNALAECFPEELRSRYMGVHFFNPPYNMTLCELIPTKYTDETLLTQMQEYLKDVLLRTVVQVKDAPAFLANRIGFQFINRAMQLAETYKGRGGIDYIDAIMGPFTGRAMSPLATADFVGLDVHKAIVDNIYQNSCDYAHETFVLPAFAAKLIGEGKLGRKAGEGLYKMEITEDGRKCLMAYDIATGGYRKKERYAFPFAAKMNQCIHNGDYREAFLALIADQSEEAQICLSLLLEYVIYGLTIAGDVGFDIHSADAAMASGFNWCPPLAIIDALSCAADFRALAVERMGSEMQKVVDLESLFKKLERSFYDYRPFLKASK